MKKLKYKLDNGNKNIDVNQIKKDWLNKLAFENKFGILQ